MSIFDHSDVDHILLSFLNIDDIKNLYQTNTYYKNLTFPILKPFIESYQKFTAQSLHYHNKQTYLAMALSYDYTQVCEYLLAKNKTYNLDELRTCFELCCEYNNLKIAKQLHLIDIDSEYEYHNGFIIGCKYGHLEIVKWLFSLENVRLLVYHGAKKSCEYGHIDIIKWIHSLSNVTILTSRLFKKSCKYGQLDIAIWLYNSYNIDIHIENDRIFVLACIRNRINVAKWLHSIGAIIDTESDRAFKRSCGINNIEIATWLCSINPRYSINVVNNVIQYSIN